MPTVKRHWFPGAMYHITARGNRKNNIFEEDADRYYYLELLYRSKKGYPFELHAYCLMPNHVHLLIETYNFPPRYFMRETHSQYARFFNKKYGFVGHLFQGRFKGQPLKDLQAFLQVSRYIHLNPCRANLTDNPESYKWSSYPQYLSLQTKHPLLTTSKIPQYFNGIEGYKKFVTIPIQENTNHSS
ncbi:transposase [Thalassobacillus pellis]|uniref:transposase n=1 Tax=Thalassobacillus pellis TaxID=748008 RepID=UPI0019614905|nr:transposase [Thalassobacillus pellis]MBM7551499.1 REP element-mobilizing transposase RayT [Thalassobacillus pellis]